MWWQIYSREGIKFLFSWIFFVCFRTSFQFYAGELIRWVNFSRYLLCKKWHRLCPLISTIKIDYKNCYNSIEIVLSNYSIVMKRCKIMGEISPQNRINLTLHNANLDNAKKIFLILQSDIWMDNLAPEGSINCPHYKYRRFFEIWTLFGRQCSQFPRSLLLSPGVSARSWKANLEAGRSSGLHGVNSDV